MYKSDFLKINLYLSIALQPSVGPWPHFQFLDLFTQSVGLLGRGISPSQVRYLHTEHKHRINAHDIHVSSGILTHDPSVRAVEDSSCLNTARPLRSAKINLYMTKTLIKTVAVCQKQNS
jgi:hypothetical protein